VIDSDIFLNPPCEEADKLQSLIVRSAVVNSQIKSKLILSFFIRIVVDDIFSRLKNTHARW
jgi:hypothetical protein